MEKHICLDLAYIISNDLFFFNYVIIFFYLNSCYHDYYRIVVALSTAGLSTGGYIIKVILLRKPHGKDVKFTCNFVINK